MRYIKKTGLDTNESAAKRELYLNHEYWLRKRDLYLFLESWIANKFCCFFLESWITNRSCCLFLESWITNTFCCCCSLLASQTRSLYLFLESWIANKFSVVCFLNRESTCFLNRPQSSSVVVSWIVNIGCAKQVAELLLYCFSSCCSSGVIQADESVIAALCDTVLFLSWSKRTWIYIVSNWVGWDPPPNWWCNECCVLRYKKRCCCCEFNCCCLLLHIEMKRNQNSIYVILTPCFFS